LSFDDILAGFRRTFRGVRVKKSVIKATTAFAVFATAGVSSLFLGASSASAATDACGAVGDLISPGVCEQTYTSGSNTFVATASMTKLEVLLVGGGGTGSQTTNGYAGGGGGDVQVVDFHGTTGNITLVVGDPGHASTAVGGATSGTALPGIGGDYTTAGGTSGSGKAGVAEVNGGAGGGAGAPGVTSAGGAGVTVTSLVGGSSLFDGDQNCYGGGGSTNTTQVCGAGAEDSTGQNVVAPAANSGGGAGAARSATVTSTSPGASGVVVVRWTAAPITLSFNAKGHGSAPAAESLTAGTAPTKPADPTATGYVFKGWYTDPGLTTAADFSAPLSSNTTFYASWAPALAATGGAPNAAELPIGVATLALGAGLVGLAAYRRRRAK
jgi:uncharacterized repeat protein (TIGR02543 family)